MSTKKTIEKIETRGRPRRIDDGRVLKHFKVRLTENEHKHLTSIAYKNNRNITNQVECIIREFIENHN